MVILKGWSVIMTKFDRVVGSEEVVGLIKVLGT